MFYYTYVNAHDIKLLNKQNDKQQIVHQNMNTYTWSLAFDDSHPKFNMKVIHNYFKLKSNENNFKKILKFSLSHVSFTHR